MSRFFGASQGLIICKGALSKIPAACIIPTSNMLGDLLLSQARPIALRIGFNCLYRLAKILMRAVSMASKISHLSQGEKSCKLWQSARSLWAACPSGNYSLFIFFCNTNCTSSENDYFKPRVSIQAIATSASSSARQSQPKSVQPELPWVLLS